jgi:hypothetical protein
MAVNGIPNALYIFGTVLPAELGAISTAEGNSTEVKTVLIPDVPPITVEGDLTMEAIQLEMPAILLYADMLGQDEQRGGLGGRLAGTLDVGIFGLVQGENAQLSGLALAEDVRNTMMYNQDRTYPGATVNEYGMTTRMLKPFDFAVRQHSQGSIITFYSLWRITYHFDRPKG